MSTEPVVVRGLHTPTGAYNHAWQVSGDLVLISGQVPLDDQGKLVSVDPTTQARQVMRNLMAVLNSAGLGPESVVKLTAYLTGVEHAPAYAAARSEVFEEPYPASTVVVVPALLAADWVLEVEALAVRSRG